MVPEVINITTVEYILKYIIKFKYMGNYFTGCGRNRRGIRQEIWESNVIFHNKMQQLTSVTVWI